MTVFVNEADAVAHWNRRVQPPLMMFDGAGNIVELPQEVTCPNWEDWTAKYVEFTEEEKADLVKRAKQIDQEFWRKPDDMPPGCGIDYWIKEGVAEVKPDGWVQPILDALEAEVKPDVTLG